MSKQIKLKDLVIEGRIIQEKFKKRLDEGFFDNLAKKIGLTQRAKPGFDYAAAIKGDIDNIEKELRSKGSSSDLLKKQNSAEGKRLQKVAIKAVISKMLTSMGLKDWTKDSHFKLVDGGWELTGRVKAKEIIAKQGSDWTFPPGLKKVNTLTFNEDDIKSGCLKGSIISSPTRRAADPRASLEDSFKKLKNIPKMTYVYLTLVNEYWRTFGVTKKDATPDLPVTTRDIRAAMSNAFNVAEWNSFASDKEDTQFSDKARSTIMQKMFRYNRPLP